MAARGTGWAVLFSGSVQEVMDLALISQASTLKSRVPFLHAFDGFRTSSEVSKVERLADEDYRAMIDDDLVRAHRARGLTPDSPVIRGTAQNPDVYFQGRETVNPYYDAVPGIVQEMMDRFAGIVGRQYRLFDYVGAPDAERVIVLMGSGGETVHETVDYLTERGEKVGVIKVRLYRPFSREHLLQALPATAKKIAVLDRTKEPGSAGEPLYVDSSDRFVRINGAGRSQSLPPSRGSLRPLRLSSQGIYAGDGEGDLRRVGEGQPEEPLYDRHYRRRQPHEPRLRSPF